MVIIVFRKAACLDIFLNGYKKDKLDNNFILIR